MKIHNKWFKMSQSCIDNSALNKRHFPCVEVGAEYIQNFFYDNKWFRTCFIFPHEICLIFLKKTHFFQIFLVTQRNVKITMHWPFYNSLYLSKQLEGTWEKSINLQLFLFFIKKEKVKKRYILKIADTSHTDMIMNE